MSELKKIPVILDGDPGHDDAIAWVLARASRELDILAVTSCCGNQTIEKPPTTPCASARSSGWTHRSARAARIRC